MSLRVSSRDSRNCELCKQSLSKADGPEVYCEICTSNIVCRKCFFKSGVRTSDDFYSRTSFLTDRHDNDFHISIDIV